MYAGGLLPVPRLLGDSGGDGAAGVVGRVLRR